MGEPYLKTGFVNGLETVDAGQHLVTELLLRLNAIFESNFRIKMA